MGVCTLLPVLLSLFPGKLWAATTHHVPALEPGDRFMKAGRHLESRNIDFYAKNGYEACQHHLQLGWLHIHRRVNCTAAFQDMLGKVDLPPRSGSPPEQMPANMTWDYLMNNQSHLKFQYEGATVSHGQREPHDWSAALIEQYMSRARKEDTFVYTPDTATVYRALDMYPVDELSGLIVGSQIPWVEAILLVAGAKSLTTVEYMPTVSRDERIVALTPGPFARQWLAGNFRNVDFVFTFSSIEHNGLGRYGDPLDATGDLKDVEALSCVLKPGGILFLGVPVGPDAVVFNVHRIYGYIRLPMLTANFKVLNIFIPGNKTLNELMSLDVGAVVHPTIVLQNMRRTPCNF